MVAMSGFGYGYVHPRIKASDVVAPANYASMSTDSDGVITIADGGIGDVSLRVMVILNDVTAANVTCGDMIRLNNSTVTGQSLSSSDTIAVASTVATLYANGSIDMSEASQATVLAASGSIVTLSDTCDCEYVYAVTALNLNDSAVVRRAEVEGYLNLNSSAQVSNASMKSRLAIYANDGDHSDGGLLEASSEIIINGGSFATVRAPTVTVASGASVAYADAATLIIYDGATVTTGICNQCLDGDSNEAITPSGVTISSDYTPTIEGFDTLSIPLVSV